MTEANIPGGGSASLSSRSRIAMAAVGALLAGLLSDLVQARGPVSATEAVAVMVLGLLAGIVGGWLTRTRWVFPLALALYMVGVELGRRSLVAPSLDVRFDTAYGIIAFLATRGVHGVLVAFPIGTGVAAGVALARRQLGTTQRRRVPAIGSWVTAALTVALAVLVAWPSSTPPILGQGGAPVAGSIAELARIRVGGSDQTVLIRAADPSKPVLLYLSGGPGQSDLALARVLSEPWTRDFVVADLDQRGNGTSYGAIDPLPGMTLDRAVSDVIEVSDELRSRFDERKIYLMGESWGTILGVLAVQRRPDLYYAWIGSGQMVDVVETDGRIYADLVAHAARSGNAALAARLAEIGTPPYRDIPWANSNLLSWYEYLYGDYTPSDGYRARGAASGLDPFGLLGSEYSFIEKTNVIRGLVDTFSAVYPQLYDLDFRVSVPRLDVPVWVLDGLAELDGRRSLMLDWMEHLQAPSKQRVEFAGAAHSVAFEQADEVLKLLTDTIVPATYGR